MSDIARENIFYCPDCSISIISPAETARCPTCKDTAEPIGWLDRVLLNDE